MTNHPPAEVLAMRLEHELHTAELHAEAEHPRDALSAIFRAQRILAQLREAMK